MRKEYLAAVRDEFDKYMRRLTPSFEPNYKGSGVPRGSRPYRLVVGNGLEYFINVLQFSNIGDFDIETAWSEKGMYPADPFGFMPEDPPKNGGTLIRLTAFHKPVRDPWCIEPPISAAESMHRINTGDYKPRDASLFMPKVPYAVAEAWEGMREYVFPYFERIAAEHGIDLRFTFS